MSFLSPRGKGTTLWQEKLGCGGEIYLQLSSGIFEITASQGNSFGGDNTQLYIFKKYFVSGGFYLLLGGSLVRFWVGGKFRW